jgi:hypothetical protein
MHIANAGIWRLYIGWIVEADLYPWRSAFIERMTIDAYVEIGENWQSIWREHLALVSRRDEVFTLAWSIWYKRKLCLTAFNEAENIIRPPPRCDHEIGCFVLTIPALYMDLTVILRDVFHLYTFNDLYVSLAQSGKQCMSDLRHIEETGFYVQARHVHIELGKALL